MRQRRLVLAIVAVVAALALFYVLRAGIPEPAAVATPTPPSSGVAPASPTASRSPASTPSAPIRYGIVTTRPSAGGVYPLELVLRSERDTAPIVNFGRVAEGYACPCPGDVAVSPDGRRLALWTHADAGTNTLQLWDATHRDRASTILTSPVGELGTRVAWSSDGAGLLLAFESVAVGPPPLRLPNTSVLRTALLSPAGAASQLTEVARVSNKTLAPLAWDRARRVVGALESEGLSRQLDYLLIQDERASRTRLPDPLTAISASPDARWVVMDRAQPPHALVYWPVDDPARMSELVPERDGQAWVERGGWLTGPTRAIVKITEAGFRPGLPSFPITLFDPATGQRTTVPGATTAHDGSRRNHGHLRAAP
jgi:hypothetical protein